MTKVIITGSKGRMGQALIACAQKNPALKIVAEIDKGDSLEAVIDPADVVVDFSAHTVTVEVAQLSLAPPAIPTPTPMKSSS